MLELGLKILIAYLLGSLNGALFAGRLAGGLDVRAIGSGNAGGTNALRARGWRFAFWVVVIDVGKGVLAAWLIAGMALPKVPVDPQLPREWIGPICAASAVVGHVYPCWFGFRGGKGAATLLGTLAVLAPVVLLPVVAVWLLVLTLSGFVGLATILGAAAAPAYLLLFGPPATPLLVFATAAAAFIAFTHRSNIARMLAGVEDRKRRVMLLRRR